jgi:CheY-like chemotaxis protein
MNARLTRILMVEDDPDIRAVAHLSLTAVGGFEVELCPSGPEALTRVPQFRPDLVLLDVMMPGMDGPATLCRLQELPSMEGIPVVFMTAKVQPQEVQEYLALGAVEVVAKPFDPMTLPTTLREIWSRPRG